jgi:DNA-binding GntR family transcriptional regulator
MGQKVEKSLTEIVYHKVKQMMLDYEIIPGQRLIFGDLAKRMGVSRTPVNTVLSILANEGFLDFVPNQGYSVHQILPEEASSLYEMREILEVGAMEKVIANLDSERVAKLEWQRVMYETAVADNLSRERFILDQDFHLSILEMTGNKYLSNYFREVYQRIFLRHRIESLRPGRALSVVEEHRRLANAIVARDVAKAKELSSAHIAAGKAYVFESIFKEAV